LAWVIVPLAEKSMSATHAETAMRLPESMSVVKHAPPLHNKGDVQSAVDVQLVRQPEPLQTKRPQLIDAAALHVPVPLHVRAGVNELAPHMAPTQTVPAP
jgi:hypothetical protein